MGNQSLIPFSLIVLAEQQTQQESKGTRRAPKSPNTSAHPQNSRDLLIHTLQHKTNKEAEIETSASQTCTPHVSHNRPATQSSPRHLRCPNNTHETVPSLWGPSTHHDAYHSTNSDQNSHMQSSSTKHQLPSCSSSSNHQFLSVL